MVIQARLEQTKGAGRRASQRRKISLESSLSAIGETVVIHDFSPGGMLIETAVDLSLFENVELDLPEADSTQAIVVWNSGRYYGCKFKEPLPKAVISAVLLRSQPKRPEMFAGPRPFVVMRTKVAESEAPQVDEADTAFGEEKAPLSVRLRVILGSAIFLWAVIIWAVWSVIKSIR